MVKMIGVYGVPAGVVLAQEFPSTQGVWRVEGGGWSIVLFTAT